MKRVLIGVLCVFASIFLMSHNTSAIDLTNNVQLVQANYPSQFYLTSVNNAGCAISMPTGTWLDRIACTSGGVRVSNMSVSIPGRTYKEGDWVIIEFSTTGGGLGYSNHFQNYGWRYSGSNPVELISVEQSSATVNTGIVRLYMRFNNTVYASALDFSGIGTQPIFEVAGQNQEAVGAIRINPTSVWQEIRQGAQKDYSQSLNNINNSLNDLKNQKEQEKQELEDQTQESESAAEDSSEEAQAAGQNLLSVIGNIFGAITSASPSSCVINGKVNNKFNMGQLDFCSLTPPPFVQIITSITLVVIILPFVISMFNKFIGLFRSFTG